MKVCNDVYEYIAGVADEMTTLNMLSVNKKFMGEEYYRRIIQKKHSYLVKLKDTEVEYKYRRNRQTEVVVFHYYMTWRQMYIKNTYYILQLEKKYHVPYFYTSRYFPEKMWVYLNKEKEPFSRLMGKALTEGNEHVVYLLKEKELVTPREWWLCRACYSGNLALIKGIYQDVKEKYANLDFRSAFITSYRQGSIEVIQFLIDKGANEEDLHYVFKATTSNLCALKFVLSKLSKLSIAMNIQEAIREYEKRLNWIVEQLPKIKEKSVKSAEKYIENITKCIEYLKSL